MSKKMGILITNLGTPDAPTPKAVHGYLAEFLADPYVVPIPKWLWLPLLHTLILPIRSQKSAKAYQKIWTVQGSPLFINSEKIAVSIRKAFQERDVNVVLGMRYGSPSLSTALEKLQQVPIDHLIVLPLYPQYSKASTGSTFAMIEKLLKCWKHPPTTDFIESYFDHPLYIAAVADSIERHWQREYYKQRETALPEETHSNSQRMLLFSFHGLPENTISQGDPYYKQCLQTAELIAAKLRLEKNQWRAVFQSRFGRQRWLKPYCDQTLRELPKEGYRRVDVICPGFPADCLETLEEIALRNKEFFLAAGGTTFHYIPCLNDTSAAQNLYMTLLDNA